MHEYVKSRRIIPGIGAMMLFTVLALVAGVSTVSLGSGENPIYVPYAVLINAFVPAVAVGTLASPMQQLDMGDTGPLWNARLWHIVGIVAFCMLLAALSAVILGGLAIVVAIRAALLWTGAAMVAATVSRDSLAWLGTLVGVAVMVFFGQKASEPTVWNWAMAGPDSVSAWLVSSVTCLGGVLVRIWRWRSNSWHRSWSRLLVRVWRPSQPASRRHSFNKYQ